MEPKQQITFDDFVKVDLRVATVLEAEPHPNADRLLKLQIDLGPLGRRQICAGVKAYYNPEDLVGKQIICVANLAPRKIRGEESNGMLLAASATERVTETVTTEGSEGEEPTEQTVTKDVVQDVVLLNPMKPVPAGSSVG